MSIGDQRLYFDKNKLYNANGSQYKGNDEFASAVLSTLNAIGTVKIGSLLLSSLSISEHNFTFTNTASNGGDRSLSFEPDREKGGGEIHAAALVKLDIESGQKIEGSAHELFHGLQFEMRQMFEGRLATVNNEVEAYLLGKAVAINVVGGSTQFGVVNTPEGQKYQQAMEALFYGVTFDLNAYQTAISNFKEGSAANLQAKGKYNSFTVDIKLTNPLIKKFIPLLQ